MLLTLLAVLLVFWLLGYGPLLILKFPLFNLNGRMINLWDVLIFLLMIYVVSALPRPLKEIASVLLLIWVLTVFGVIAIAGLSNILILSLIVGLIIYILSNK